MLIDKNRERMLIRYEKKYKEMESKKDFCDSWSRSNGSRAFRMRRNEKRF